MFAHPALQTHGAYTYPSVVNLGSSLSLGDTAHPPLRVDLRACLHAHTRSQMHIIWHTQKHKIARTLSMYTHTHTYTHTLTQGTGASGGITPVPE